PPLSRCAVIVVVLFLVSSSSTAQSGRTTQKCCNVFIRWDGLSLLAMVGTVLSLFFIFCPVLPVFCLSVDLSLTVDGKASERYYMVSTQRAKGENQSPINGRSHLENRLSLLVKWGLCAAALYYRAYIFYFDCFPICEHLPRVACLRWRRLIAASRRFANAACIPFRQRLQTSGTQCSDCGTLLLLGPPQDAEKRLLLCFRRASSKKNNQVRVSPGTFT
ncbi:unnamed protein product, partial [Scytosiphon promiscuus]